MTLAVFWKWGDDVPPDSGGAGSSSGYGGGYRRRYWLGSKPEKLLLPKFQARLKKAEVILERRKSKVDQLLETAEKHLEAAPQSQDYLLISFYWESRTIFILPEDLPTIERAAAMFRRAQENTEMLQPLVLQIQEQIQIQIKNQIRANNQAAAIVILELLD